MAWTDYHKAYDMVPHSWIVECLEMLGIATKMIVPPEEYEEWKAELTCEQTLGVVNISRGIFQEDSLLPLLFVLCMIPLSFVLITSKDSSEWRGRELKINHLLFMDDLNLFRKSNDQIDSLV